MVEQDRTELVGVGDQRFDRALGELGKGLVGGSEDSEGTVGLQGLYQARGLNRGDQGIKASGRRRRRDDVSGVGRLRRG